MISLIRIKAITKKEFSHILRDPFTLAVALFIPFFLVTIFGFAIDFDVKHLELGVFDSDKSQSSRVLAQTFLNSGYFDVEEKDLTLSPADDLIKERANAVLIIPEKFERDLERIGSSKVQLLLDGTDNSSIASIMGYVGGVQNSAINKLYGESLKEPIEVKQMYLFNPGLKSNWFVVPGLSVVVIAILSILLTALTVTREWEVGSMELLLSTPVRPIEIIIGKLTPYLGLAVFGATLVYLSARLIFGIPFKGSHILLILGTVLFLSAYLAQGLIISVITRKQQIAMQMGIVLGLLPSLLLSGFIFSIENMSPFWRNFTSIFPAKWFMIISRALYLKGSSFFELIIPFTVLFVMSFILVLIAAKRFQGNLEQ